MIQIYLKHYDECPQNQKHDIEHNLGLEILAYGLNDIYDISIPFDQLDSAIQKNDYGKPHLRQYPNIHFNISHCDGIVACGFSEDVLGVDIEMIDTFLPSIIKKVFTKEEADQLEESKENSELYQEYFYRFWTLKESRIKEAGLGFHMSVTDFHFHFDMSTNPPGIICSEPDLYFHQYIIEDKYVLATCSKNPTDDVRIITLS